MIKSYPIDIGNKQTREAAYHTLVLDRSGSMTGVIRQVCHDAASRLDLIASGDRCRIMWYSTEGGTWGVAFDGILNKPEMYQRAKDATLKLASTIGLTCFSEVLADWAHSLSGWQGPKTITLFTDGYPVVNNIRKEDSQIAAALSEAASNGVDGAVMVGYGYYDRDRLTNMSNKLGGAVVHCENIRLFGEVYGMMVSDTEPVQTVTVGNLPDDALVFTIRNGLPSRLVVQNGQVKATDTVYVAHSSYAQTGLSIPLEAAYAAAFLYNQNGLGDLAQDVIAMIGDVALFNSISNAVTTQEHGKFEAAALDAVSKTDTRFINGKRSDLVIDPHAYSLMSLLHDLRQIDALFAPSPEWKYKRIGAASEPVDEPKVTWKPDYRRAESDFDDVVFASDRINLSVRVRIPGTLTVNADGQAVGLPETLPSFVWRNYSLMVDGRLNVDTIPVKAKLGQLDRLPVRFEQRGSDDTYHWGLLHIGNLPVMNRAQIGATSTMGAIGKMLYAEQVLKSEQKVLNDLLAPHRQELRSEAFTKIYGVDAAAWLAEQGVTDSGYNPKVRTVESEDSYPAQIVTFALGGFSSLPKVDEVKAAMQLGKATTPSKAVMAKAIEKVDGDTKNIPSNLLPQWADSRLKVFRKDLATLRGAMTAAKFAVVFGKRWFTDLPSREVDTLAIDTPVGELKATVKTSEKQIKI
jgi:hypothetical protein